jgi:hypothetical protein
MDLFTYLLGKKGINSSVHGDLFSYLLGKGQSQIYTVSGTTIYIPNAKKLVSFMMTKESTQETTTGKNKIDFTRTNTTVNGVSYLCENTYQMQMDGTATGNGTIHCNNTVLLGAGTYVFQLSIESGSITSNDITSNFILRNEDTATNIISINVNNNDNKYAEFTLTEATNVKARMYVRTNMVFNNAVINLNVIEGSTPDYIFEEYTGGQPSPNPDYPQEVKTVTGYRNLFDDIWETGSISTSTGENSSASKYKRTHNYTSVLPNTTYNFNIYQIEQQIVIFYYNGTTFLSFDYRDNISNISFTTPSDCTNIRVRIQTTNDIDKAQLNKGTEELPYVSYGSNYILYKQVGKNLFDKNNVNWYRNNNDAFENTNNTSANRIRTSSFEIEGGKTYIISGIPDSVNLLRYFSYNESKSSLGVGYFSDNSFILDKDAKYIQIQFSGTGFTNATNELMANANIQIEEGSTATTYEEYKETTIPLPLNGNEIVGIGNYLDEYIVDKNGHCWLNKLVNKVVLDGSESWETQWSIAGGNNVNGYRTNIANILKTTSSSDMPKIICNYYTVSTQNECGFNSGRICSRTNQSQIIITNNDILNTNDFKTWLSTHNTEVYYVLETPEPIDLQTTVDLKLFKGVNNITNSEDGNMTIQYR